MKPVQIEKLTYFYLKYIHEMNKIRILLKDAIEIKKHIESLEGKKLCQN